MVAGNDFKTEVELLQIQLNVFQDFSGHSIAICLSGFDDIPQYDKGNRASRQHLATYFAAELVKPGSNPIHSAAFGQMQVG